MQRIGVGIEGLRQGQEGQVREPQKLEGQGGLQK
jgi:hypothetical protein